jgi:hypothetical protein
MAKYIPLQKYAHFKMGYSMAKDFFFAQKDSVAPITLEEIVHVSTNLPVAFVRDSSGAFRLVVLLSLVKEKNLLVHPSGKWFSGYIPAHYRSYPFALLRSAKNENLTLCIDTESGLFRENPTQEELRFFTEAGELETVTASLLQFLEAREKAMQTTHAIVKRIADAGIITPWKIPFKDENGTEQEVPGIYRIDENRLNSLSEDEFLKLRNVLSVIYAILMSENRLSNLAKLHTLHAQMAQKMAPKEEEFDLDKFFAENNDTLSF